MTGQIYVAVRTPTTLTEQTVKKKTKRQKRTSKKYDGPNFHPKELLSEFWLPVNGYEGQYEVSSLGRIKSLVRNGRPAKIRKTQLGWDGREKVTFKTGRNITKSVIVSRLVAIAFHPNPESKPEVNHIDGNPLNNRANNLEWSTTLENLVHRIKMSLSPGAVASVDSGAVLREVVSALEQRKSTGSTAKDIAAKFGIGIWTVHRISSNLNALSNSSLI